MWTDKSEDDLFMTAALQDAQAIRVVGVLRPTGEASTGMASGVIGYRGDLMQHMIQSVADSEVVKAQKQNPDTDVLTGLPFDTGEENNTVYSMAWISAME